MFLGSTGHRVAIALAVVLALISVLVCGAIWVGYLPTTRAVEAENHVEQVEAELKTAQSNLAVASLAAENAQATASALASQLEECELKLTPTPEPESRDLFAGVGAGAEASETLTVTVTPVLTMQIVQPLIDAMGTGGHPGHETVGNEGCSYWLDPKYIRFGDDTGPNTSGIQVDGDTLFEFNLAGIADYKDAPTDFVFVAEAAYTEYRGGSWERVYLVTPGRDTLRLHDAALFLLPSQSVDPFLALREAAQRCKNNAGNGVVDFRSGSAVVTTPVPPAPTATPEPPNPTTAPPVAEVSYTFAGQTGAVASGKCANLEGKSGQLVITVPAGLAFAISGRESEVTDWLIANGDTSVTKSAWTGFWICAGQTPDTAAEALIANDPNAQNNQRVEW